MRVFVGELRGTVDRLAFGPGQRLVAACAGRDRIDLWDAVTGTRADSWQAARREVLALGMLPDGRAVVAVDRQPLQIIDPDPYRKYSETFPASRGSADAVAVASDSPLLVTVQREDIGQLTVWRPGPNGRYMIAWSEPCQAPVSALGIADDGGVIGAEIVSSLTPRIVIWNASTGAEQARFAAPSWQPMGRLMFLPNRRRVVTRNTNGVTVWAYDEGNAVAEFATDLLLSDLAAHPDGRHLLTADAEGVVRVWDADTGAEVRAYHWDVGRLGSVAVSRDGLLAAAGGEDGKIVVWDVDL